MNNCYTIASTGVRWLVLISLATLITAAWIPRSATAITASGIDDIVLGHPFYDPTGAVLCSSSTNCTCTAGGGSSLVGSDNQEKAWNFLVGKQLSPTQVAGIMGNLLHESGLDPFNQQNDQNWPAGGWGIAQWTNPGRRDAIQAAVTEQLGGQFYVPTEQAGSMKGTADEDQLLRFQLEYLYDESVGRDQRGPAMPSGYDAAKVAAANEWEGITKTTTVEEAVIYWEWNYERAGVPALGSRLAAANDMLARFGSNTAGTPAGTAGSGTTTCLSNGQAAGGFSLPLDRSHYDANPQSYSKPHHDYPAADIPAATGTPVYAVTSGKILSAPTNGSCGLGILIDAGNGVQMSYCHGTDGGSIDGAREGDTVVAGQLIMHVGSTGNSSGPHLHFQIRASGTLRCPQTLLVGIANGAPPAISSLPTGGCSY